VRGGGARGRLRRRCVTGCVALFVVLAGAPAAEQAGSPNAAAGDSTAEADLASQPDLPALGKWMIGADGTPAHWMGQTYAGKGLREPINVIIIDEGAKSASQASARLMSAAAEAGYPVRMGHSTGYQAYLGGQTYQQIPRGWDDALSDGPFELSNNHGRLFGPHRTARAYVLTGAFSREEVDLFRWPGHRYASFGKARDDFAERLARTSRYRLIGFVSLDNSAVDDPEVSTGDHDGKAALLAASR
jgi:hypothetical protein